MDGQRIWRSLAFGAVLVAGVISIVATSPPPPATTRVWVEPSVVCPGDSVSAFWETLSGGDGRPTPSALRFHTQPADGTDPSLDGVLVSSLTGSREAVALASSFIVAVPEDGFADLREHGTLSVLPCDGSGRQWPLSESVSPLAIEVDPVDGSVLTAFRIHSGDTRLMRLGMDLQTIWEDTIGASNVTLAARGDGGWFVAGQWNPPDEGAFLSALEPDGNLRWTRPLTMATPEATQVQARAMAADPLGGVLVAGQFRHEDSGLDAFLHRYDEDGDLLWELELRSPGTANERIVDLEVAADGTVYVGGTTGGDLAGPRTGITDTFVMSFDLDGEPLPFSVQVVGSPSVIVSKTLSLVGDDLLLMTAGRLVRFDPAVGLDLDSETSWSFQPPEGEQFAGFTGLANGHVLVATEFTVDIDLPQHTFGRPLPHLDLRLRGLDEDADAVWTQDVGSLAGDRLRLAVPWSQAGAGAALIAGLTDGHLLAEHQGNDGFPHFRAETFLLRVGD